MAHGEIDKLAEALSKAQGTMLPAGLNSTNPFFKSKYADLGSIIAAAKKPMADNGLSVVQLVETPDGTVAVTTILMHLSGQSISATVTLPIAEERGKSMAQVIASNATYLRRIGYAAMLGVCADEDSDGQQPAARPQAPAQPKAQAQSTAAQTPAAMFEELVGLREQIKELDATKLPVKPAIVTEKAINEHRDIVSAIKKEQAQ